MGNGSKHSLMTTKKKAGVLTGGYLIRMMSCTFGLMTTHHTAIAHPIGGGKHKYSQPKTEYEVNQNQQVAKYINVTGPNTYEAPSSSSSSESYERVECVYCDGSGTTWGGWVDC